MSIDTVGNFLTIIRNALKVYKRSTKAPYSKLNAEIARVLKEEGYIKDYKKEDISDVKAELLIYLKYVDGESSIHEIVRLSTPGRRRYSPAASLKPVIGGLGISILTTNQGVISDRHARSKVVGGELLCYVW
ncbi:30S ribosomal protein S8 [Candidatus Babeliales bacterium]|nr:30S ribosomal protein S8 [Candidatus Babeliales bacterium]